MSHAIGRSDNDHGAAPLTSPFLSDEVDLGPHLGVTHRPRDVVAAATAMRMAASTRGERAPASDALRKAWARHRGIQDAARLARHAREYCVSKVGLENYIQQHHSAVLLVTARQQRIFDLLMEGMSVPEVRTLEAEERAAAAADRAMQSKARRAADSGSMPMQSKGLQGADSGWLPMQSKVVPPPRGNHCSGVVAAAAGLAASFEGSEETRAAVEQPSLQRKPPAKAKVKDVFPSPQGPEHDFEKDVYVWMLRQCTRDMRAAQRRDEPQPTVDNMTLLRIEEVFEHGSGFIEGMGSDPVPSHRKNTFREWLTEGWIQRSARRAAETAEAGYDRMRLLKEEEAGRRGGENSRSSGKVVTIEMVQQPGIPQMSIAEAAKALGCSPRTIASRRAEIRALEAAAVAERADGPTGEIVPAAGRTAPSPAPQRGPLRALTGDLDLSFLAFKDEKFRQHSGHRSQHKVTT